VPELQGLLLQNQQNLNQMQEQQMRKESTEQERPLKRKRLARLLLWSVPELQGLLLQNQQNLNQMQEQQMRKESTEQERPLKRKRLARQLLWSVPELQGPLPQNQHNLNQMEEQSTKQERTEQGRPLKRKRLARQLLWSVPELQGQNKGVTMCLQILVWIVRGKRLRRRKPESKRHWSVREPLAWMAKVSQRIPEVRKRKQERQLPLNGHGLPLGLTGPGKLLRRRRSAKQLLWRGPEERAAMPTQVQPTAHPDPKLVWIELSKPLSRRKPEKLQPWNVPAPGRVPQGRQKQLRSWALDRTLAGVEGEA